MMYNFLVRLNLFPVPTLHVLYVVVNFECRSGLWKKQNQKHLCFFSVPKHLWKMTLKKSSNLLCQELASAFRESAEQDRCLLFARC